MTLTQLWRLSSGPKQQHSVSSCAVVMWWLPAPYWGVQNSGEGRTKHRRYHLSKLPAVLMGVFSKAFIQHTETNNNMFPVLSKQSCDGSWEWLCKSGVLFSWLTALPHAASLRGGLHQTTSAPGLNSTANWISSFFLTLNLNRNIGIDSVDAQGLRIYATWGTPEANVSAHKEYYELVFSEAYVFNQDEK